MNNKLFEEKTKINSKIEKFTNTLYKDIFLSYDINFANTKGYTLLQLKSNNSIYTIQAPYITWLVLKKDKTLIRLESAKKITLPIREEFKKTVFLDVVIKNCEEFNINLSKDKKSILSFIKIKNQNPIVFEVEKL